MTKGRPKSVDYSPEEFKNLSKEERKLRMRLSDLKEKIIRRENKVEEWMIPIKRLQDEINTFKKEIEDLKTSIKDMGFEFPTFRVEGFVTKGNSYWRGVWYVSGKKNQKYLGSEDKVFSLVGSKVKGFSKLPPKQREEKIKEYFHPELQLEFWKRQHQESERRKGEEYVKWMESQETYTPGEWVDYMTE